MKKFLALFLICFVFVGCTRIDFKTGIVFQKPNENILPTGFKQIREAGNGWYLYSSPVGYFLVSVQGPANASPFIDMVFIGTELAR